MLSKNQCFYCAEDEKLNDLMMKIVDLNTSVVYLLKEQTYKGRCVVAFNQHKEELYQMTSMERSLFMEDVSKIAEVIGRIYQPSKINYAIYGDLVPHVHVHIVPKYKDGDSWGKPFNDKRQDKKFLLEEEYDAMVELIKNDLNSLMQEKNDN